jgi:adenosylcobinamide-GDP ribazoletransferase
MSLRGLRLATQFLTRIPVPPVTDYSPEELSRSATWFPLVGVAIGLVVSCIVYLCAHRNGVIAAALGVLTWTWLTGALHLDGLADLTDALAASHRDPQKFLTVLADPHIGAFGAVSVALALLLKSSALTSFTPSGLVALPLIPAWARLGTMAWSRWLKPLKPGHGERFAWHLHTAWIVFWVVVLSGASALTAPILCVAPLVLAAWGGWLRVRLGGITGDCLGAGVEFTEVVLVIALGLAGTTGALL